MSQSNSFARYVFHKGKYWFNPGHAPDHSGRISLYSLREDGAGVVPSPEEIHNASEDQIKAIWQAQAAGQLIKF